jgi:Subtilisin inhibitor-like
MRPTGMRHASRVLAATVVALGLVAGCASPSTVAGGGASGGSGGGSAPGSPSARPSVPAPSVPAPTAPAPTPPKRTDGTSLIVMLDRGPGAASSTWTLACDPPAGTHPMAAAACAQLAATPGDPFAETPRNLMCTMIYGGPEKAHVWGTYDGRPVDTTFARTNGCEETRWQRVSTLLVITTAGGLQG